MINARRPQDGKTLHLAPTQFKPDTKFKAGKDGAPANHIQWKPPYNINPIQAYAVQVRVPKGVLNSYYMVGGFNCGYCGIQTLDTVDKTFNLFSVWNDTTASSYCKNLETHPNVKTNEFGGEGAGSQTRCTNDKAKGENNVGNWINDVTYTMVVEAHHREDGVVLNMSLYDPAKGWIKFASTFRPMGKPDSNNRISGFNSFIEAFGQSKTLNLRRNGYWGGCWFKFDNEKVWKNCTEMTSTTTAEIDRPDKQVIKVTMSDGYDLIHMAAGGDAMEDGNYGLYSGPVNFMPPPDFLMSFQGYNSL